MTTTIKLDDLILNMNKKEEEQYLEAIASSIAKQGKN